MRITEVTMKYINMYNLKIDIGPNSAEIGELSGRIVQFRKMAADRDSFSEIIHRLSNR